MTTPDRQTETDHEALEVHRRELEASYHRLIEEVVNEGRLDVVDEIVDIWESIDTLRLFEQLGVIDPLTERVSDRD